MAKVGAPLITIRVESDAASPVESEPTTSKSVATHATVVQAESTRSKELRALATPAVRRIAREHNMDISKVNLGQPTTHLE